MVSGTAQEFALAVGPNAFQIKVTDTATSIVTSYTISAQRQPQAISSVAALSSLSIAPVGGFSTLQFNQDTRVYSVRLATDVTTVVVSYTLFPGGTIVISSRGVNLLNQVSPFLYTASDLTLPLLFIVTAEDESSTATYSVTFTRMDASEMAEFYTLQALNIVPGVSVIASSTEVSWNVRFNAALWTSSSGTGTLATAISKQYFRAYVNDLMTPTILQTQSASAANKDVGSPLLRV